MLLFHGYFEQNFVSQRFLISAPPGGIFLSYPTTQSSLPPLKLPRGLLFLESLWPCVNHQGWLLIHVHLSFLHMYVIVPSLFLFIPLRIRTRITYFIL